MDILSVIDRYSWERFTTPQSRNGIRSLYDDNDADYLLAIIPFISVWWMPMNWCVPVVNTLTQIEESENFWCLQANNNYYANVTFAWREYALKGTHNTHRNNSTTHSIHSLHMKRSSPENNRTIWIMPALWIGCARATQMDRIIVHDVCVGSLIDGHWLAGYWIGLFIARDHLGVSVPILGWHLKWAREHTNSILLVFEESHRHTMFNPLK